MSTIHIFTLEIDEDKKQFALKDSFSKLSLDQMTGVIGFMSQILHNWHHISGEKQNEFSLKLKEGKHE